MKYRHLIIFIMIGYACGSIGGCVLHGNAQNSRLSVCPLKESVLINQSFDVEIRLVPVCDVKGWEVKLLFDMKHIRADSVSCGSFFQEFLTFFNPGFIDNSNGTIKDIYGVLLNRTGNISEEGVLCTVSFTALREGEARISVFDEGVANGTAYVPLDTADGSVNVMLAGGGTPLPASGTPHSGNEMLGWFIPLVFILFVGALVWKVLT